MNQKSQLVTLELIKVVCVQKRNSALAVKESSTSLLARGNENIDAASGGNVGDQFAELLRNKAKKSEIPMKSSPHHADV